MNAVQYGLSKIHLTIPNEVLVLAFRDPDPTRDQLVSLDDKIMTNFIRPHVMQDMNVVGGIPINVDLSLCQMQWLQSNEYLMVIPKNLTNGQPIISVEEFVNAALAPNFTMNYSNRESPLIASADKMYSNLSPSNVMQTTRIELLGENRVLISDPSITPIYGILRCTIAHNGNLENIPPKMHNAVAQLFTLGVKSYIYNKMKVKIDQGIIYGGHELSSITEIIDSYSDSYEQYIEYLTTTWRKASYLSSADNTARLIKLSLGNNI